MIKSVTVTNDVGESLKMILAEPWRTGLQIEKIEGLGPVKANINQTELATSDGSVFNSARITSRNIVFTIALREKIDEATGGVLMDIEQVRHTTYKYFPIKKSITLLIETDTRICEISGNVESNEPDIFSKKETAQISIICPDPFFYATNRMMVLNGVDAEFEFPFSNESLSEHLISFGEITYEVGSNNFYEGDADSGLVIDIHAVGTAKDITIVNTQTKKYMTIDTGKFRAIVGGEDDDVLEGDDIIISTISGNKYVRLLRNGIYYNILSTLPKMSDWLTLSKGNNIFAYAAESGVTNLRVNIQSYILYEGI